VVFALGAAAFFLSFFHRVSTGAIADDLQRELSIGAAALGTLGATYYYVYALMQIPAGALADSLGPRATLTGGVLVAGAGSVAFGLASGFASALVARTLIGLGVSVIFVCTLKLHANWFSEGRFATAAGATNVAGIAGAFAATVPLAWLVSLTPWRNVFVAIGIVSLVLAMVIWQGAALRFTETHGRNIWNERGILAGTPGAPVR
jgi:MFS family permease